MDNPFSFNSDELRGKKGKFKVLSKLCFSNPCRFCFENEVCELEKCEKILTEEEIEMYKELFEKLLGINLCQKIH